MIHRRLLTLATALALASFTAPAARASAVADLESVFSTNLKFTTAILVSNRSLGGGITEETARVVSMRFTARDILEQMIEDGDIAGPLAGWKIVARTRSDTVEALDHALYAVKRGQPDHPLGDIETGDELLDFQLGPTFTGGKVRYRQNDIVSGSGTFLGSYFGTFSADGEELALGGTIRAPFSFKKASLDGVAVSVLVPGKITLTAQGGAEIYDNELGYVPLVIEGTFTFAPHTITAVHASDSER